MNRVLELQYLIGQTENLILAKAIGDPEAPAMQEKLNREMTMSQRRIEVEWLERVDANFLSMKSRW